MPSEQASVALLGALSKLLAEVSAVPLRLDVPGVDAVRKRQGAVVDQLSDYVLPRLVQLDAPLLTVVGGSTGAGKSTLVNSICGERVTESGVLRPTTRSPVLVHHPDDAEWFLPDRILPDLPRTDVPTNDVYALRVATSDPGPARPRHPRRARRRLHRRGATASSPPSCSPRPTCGCSSRPRRATPTRCRGTTCARPPSAARPWPSCSTAPHADAVIEVRGHLARMMTSRGLSDSPLFTVPESGTDTEGLLPPEAVAPIVGWLHDLAADPNARQAVVSQTLDGAVRHNVLRTHDIADALDVQIEAAGHLYSQAEDDLRRGRRLRRPRVLRRHPAERRGARAVAGVRRHRRDGALGRGARHPHPRAARRGRHRQAHPLHRGRRGDRGRPAVARRRLRRVGGRGGHPRRGAPTRPAAALLAATRGLDRASHDLRTRAERIVRDWQAEVLETVRVEGSDKRMTAKFLAFGVNGVGATLMVVRARARGRTRRTLRGRPPAARGDLRARPARARWWPPPTATCRPAGRRLLQEEKQRFLDLLDSPDTVRATQDTLRDAARRAEYARHTDFLDGDTTS